MIKKIDVGYEVYFKGEYEGLYLTEYEAFLMLNKLQQNLKFITCRSL